MTNLLQSYSNRFASKSSLFTSTSTLFVHYQTILSFVMLNLFQHLNKDLLLLKPIRNGTKNSIVCQVHLLPIRQLKNWHRQWKINLIEEHNPNWDNLWNRDAETSSA
jgi:hypothetical protein